MSACSVDERAEHEAEAVRALLPQLKRFLSESVDGRALDGAGQIPRSVREGLAELGLFGMTVPEAYGGAGFSLASACCVVERIARVDCSIAIMVGLHAGLGTRGLVEHGAGPLRARWLPQLASGRCVASFAATEADAGSDLTAIRTRGVATEAGVRVCGEKSYVTNGGFAGLFTVLATTPGMGGNRAHSLICVPAETPGVRIGLEEDKLGIRASSTVTVTFDDAVVPGDHVLGNPGTGMSQAHGLLTWGRTLMSAGCVGTARGALDLALSHVSTRRQFGRSVAHFGATRAHIAWMAVRVQAMDALVRELATAHGRGAATDIDSALAKVFCSEGAFDVCDRAVQLHGALGFIEATGVARKLRDCRITRIFEGANDVLLVRVGSALLAAPERAFGEPEPVTRAPGAKEAADRIEAAIGLLVAEAVRFGQRLGVRAIHQQMLLQALARAAMCLRAARASLRRSPDVSLGCISADILVDEAHGWLARIPGAEREQSRAEFLTERLYDDMRLA